MSSRLLALPDEVFIDWSLLGWAVRDVNTGQKIGRYFESWEAAHSWLARRDYVDVVHDPPITVPRCLEMTKDRGMGEGA